MGALPWGCRVECLSSGKETIKTDPPKRTHRKGPATSKEQPLSLTSHMPTTNQAGPIGGQSGQTVGSLLFKAITTEQIATTKPMTSSGLVSRLSEPIGEQMMINLQGCHWKDPILYSYYGPPRVSAYTLFLLQFNHGNYSSTMVNNTTIEKQRWTSFLTKRCDFSILVKEQSTRTCCKGVLKL